MKLQLKSGAIKLRKLGYSISEISKKLKVSKSTTSLWCRQIVLTEKQKELLEVRTGRKLIKFFRIVANQKKERDIAKQKIISLSKRELQKLSTREIFIAGVALYWAEGFKHTAESRIGFCNSDPQMIKFMMLFLKRCMGVESEDISPRLTLNIAFKNKTEIIQKYWSKYLGIPEGQFTKPFYQKVKQIKVYENSNTSYHGVLRIHVKKSSNLLLRMRGYLEGLKNN